MKRNIFIIGLLIFTLCYCSKNGSNNEEEASFTLEGTVYIDDTPGNNVTVEFCAKPAKYSSSSWGSDIVRYTDENGQYTFTEKTGASVSYAIMYRVRVENPATGLFSSYREGNSPIGTIKTEDFYLYSQ